MVVFGSPRRATTAVLLFFVYGPWIDRDDTSQSRCIQPLEMPVHANHLIWDASVERNTWMHQSREVVAQRISIIGADNVKFKRRGQKQLILLKFDERAGCAVE